MRRSEIITTEYIQPLLDPISLRSYILQLMAQHQVSNQSPMAPPSFLPAIDIYILACCHRQVRSKLCRYRFLIAISTETVAGFSNACKNKSIATLQIDVHTGYYDHKYNIFIYKNLQV